MQKSLKVMYMPMEFQKSLFQEEPKAVQKYLKLEKLVQAKKDMLLKEE